MVDAYVNQVAARLDGLPLALATAGTYIQKTGLGFQEYLQAYDKCWEIDPLRPTKLGEYERTLYTTWDLSYTRLRFEDPDAANFLKLLAYFDNKYLSYKYFKRGITHESPGWLRRIMENDIAFRGIMGFLVQYSFIQVDTKFKIWSVHNCVHDWILAALNKDISADLYWYAMQCMSNPEANVQPDMILYTDMGHVDLIPLARHASWLVQQRFLDKGMISGATQGQIRQASNIAEFLHCQGQLVAAEHLYAEILREVEKEQWDDLEYAVGVFQEIGNVLANQGKLKEAEEAYERALDMTRMSLSPDHALISSISNNLGLVYFHQKKFRLAMRIFWELLDDKKETKVPKGVSIIAATCNLAMIYEIQNKLNIAERMYVDALALCNDKIPGVESKDTMFVIKGLVEVYLRLDILDKAENMCVRLRAGLEARLGEDHKSTIEAVAKLATIYRKRDKLDDAERMFKWVLERVLNTTAECQIFILKVTMHLGLVYHKQGKLQQAEEMLILAMRGLGSELGPDDYFVLESIEGLKRVYGSKMKLKG